ncbi:MAG: hypothetical protein V4714_01710 [Bacteroidota bacterium]
MIRYINYVLTAIMIMLVLPLMPVLAIAVIPVAFIYNLIEPRASFWQNFSFRRMVRSIGFKPPKKAMAFYVFWLYVHLVFLGAFSSGMFSSDNMNLANFWPFNSDIRVYDITEFMLYTGPPLFLIIMFGLTRNEFVEEQTIAFAGHSHDKSYEAVNVSSIPAKEVAEMPTTVTTTTNKENTIVYSVTPEVPVVETPVNAATNNQELFKLLQQQQQRIEMLDAELQNLKARMTINPIKTQNS